MARKFKSGRGWAYWPDKLGAFPPPYRLQLSRSNMTVTLNDARFNNSAIYIGHGPTLITEPSAAIPSLH